MADEFLPTLDFYYVNSGGGSIWAHATLKLPDGKEIRESAYCQEADNFMALAIGKLLKQHPEEVARALRCKIVERSNVLGRTSHHEYPTTKES